LFKGARYIALGVMGARKANSRRALAYSVPSRYVRRVGRYQISLDASFKNVPRGEWWLDVREALNGDWDHPVSPMWEARYEFHARDGEPLLTRVELRPWANRAPEGGVTARLLRELRIGEAYAAVRAFLVGQLKAIAAGDYPEAVRRGLAQLGGDEQARKRLEKSILQGLAEWTDSHPDRAPTWNVHAAGYTVADALKEPRRPGRRGRDDAFFAAFAAEYVARVAEGSSRPVAELAKRRHLSPERVRDVLHQARTRELLTRPASGKAGGHLTEKALALFGEQTPHSDKEQR
jgi:hypothetical protein